MEPGVLLHYQLILFLLLWYGMVWCGVVWCGVVTGVRLSGGSDGGLAWLRVDL